MRYSQDGIVWMGGSKLIEVQGFLTESNEVILSDCDSIGDWKKIKVKFEPETLKYWINENVGEIEDICTISII